MADNDTPNNEAEEYVSPLDTVLEEVEKLPQGDLDPDEVNKEDADFVDELFDKFPKAEDDEGDDAGDDEGGGDAGDDEGDGDSDDAGDDEGDGDDAGDDEGDGDDAGDDEFPENIDGDEKEVAKWGELRSELYAARDENAELKERLESIQSGSDSELGDLRTEVETLRKELSISKVESTPEYEQMVTRPVEAILDRAEAIAKAHDISGEALVDAITDTNIARQSQALNDLIETLPERERAVIYRMADDMSAIYSTEAQLRDNAATALEEAEELARERSAKEARVAAQKYKAAVDKVIPILSDRLPKEFVDVEALAKEVKDTDLSKSSLEAQSYSIAAGHVLPKIVAELQSAQKEILKLQKRIASKNETTPTAKTGAKPTPKKQTTTQTPKSDIGDDVGFLDAIDQQI